MALPPRNRRPMVILLCVWSIFEYLTHSGIDQNENTAVNHAYLWAFDWTNFRNTKSIFNGIFDTLVSHW